MTKNHRKFFFFPLGLAFFLVLLDFIFHWRHNELITASWHSFNLFHSLLLIRSLLYLSCLGIYLLCWKKFFSLKTFISALLLTAIFDIGSYQYFVLKSIPRFNGALFSPLFVANKIPLTETREETNEKSSLFENYHDQVPSAASAAQTLYPFLGLDPCYPNYRMDIIANSSFDFFTAVGGQPRANGPAFFNTLSRPFQELIGCHAPKWRLFSNYIFSTDPKKSLANLKDPLNILILSSPSNVINEKQASLLKKALSDKIIPKVLTPNMMRFLITNSSSHSEAFFYADAYNSHWRAFLDGEKIPLYVADLGFKAVIIPPGLHQITLRYIDWANWAGRYFIFLVDLVFCLTLIFYILFYFICPSRKT